MQSPLSREVFLKGVENLARIFGPLADDKLETYYFLMKHIPDPDFKKTVVEVLRTHDHPYFPMPVHILYAYNTAVKVGC